MHVLLIIIGLPHRLLVVVLLLWPVIALSHRTFSQRTIYDLKMCRLMASYDMDSLVYTVLDTDSDDYIGTHTDCSLHTEVAALAVVLLQPSTNLCNTSYLDCKRSTIDVCIALPLHVGLILRRILPLAVVIRLRVLGVLRIWLSRTGEIGIRSVLIRRHCGCRIFVVDLQCKQSSVEGRELNDEESMKDQRRVSGSNALNIHQRRSKILYTVTYDIFRG